MIEDLLKDKNAQEKAQIKSKELAKVKLGKFTKDDFDIEIIGDIKEIDGGIELFATAYKNGEQLGFGKDGTVEIERFRFYNPPVLVDDENGDIVKESIDKETNTKVQRKLKYDTTQAIKEILIKTIIQVCKGGEHIEGGKIGNTTSTFYPAAGANSPVDGTVGYEVGNWDTVHDATTGTKVGVTSGDDRGVLARQVSSVDFRLQRAFFLFDTSPLGSDIIDSAIFSVTTGALPSSGSGWNWGIVQSSPANNDNLVVADYNQCGSVNSPTEGATRQSIGGGGITYDFTLNATGEGWVNGSGITKLGVRDALDMDDSQPSGNTYNTGIRFADYTGTTTDPKLVVVHFEEGYTGNKYSIDLEASSSQYLSAVDSASLSITGDITMEAWIKLEQLPSTAGSRFDIINKDDSYEFFIRNSDDKIKFISTDDGTFDAGSQLQFTGNTAITAIGTWMHLAVVVDVSAQTAKMYINGSEIAVTNDLQNATTIYNSSGKLGIGANDNGGSPTNYFDGLIDEPRVWNDVRTQEEITDNAWKQLDGDEAGLVGYWKLNDDLTDETSNGNDLTAVNSPVFSSTIPFPDDSPDNSHSIDLESGSSQYLDISDADQTGLDFTGDFTIEFWHKPESLWGELISRWDIPSGAHRSIRITESADAGGRIKLDISANGTDVTEVYWTYIPTAGAWYHLAMTYDASAGSAELFINGVSQGTKTGLPTSLHDHGRFLIGALGANPANSFIDGLIEDVRVWNDIRTDAEIFDNMATELDGDEANLVAYWKLNDSLLDETSNNNDLTNNNSATFSTTVPFCGSSTGVSGNSNFLMFM